MVIYDERSGDDFRGNLRIERRRSERIDKMGRDSAHRVFNSQNIPDVSRLPTHYASRKNPNYVTTSNHYHSTSVPAAGANREAQLPATTAYRARLALTPAAEIDTRGDCSVIRLISREINIEVSLGEASCERSLPAR